MSRSRLFALLLALLLVGIVVNNAWHNMATTKGNDNLSLAANYDGFTYSLTDTSNNPISSVSLSLKVRPFFDGPVVFWSASGSYTAIIKNSQGVKVATISPSELPEISGSGSSLVNGSLVTVASIVISAGTIQNAYSGWVAGARYSLVIHLTGLSMSLMFNDGAVKAPTSISMPSDASYTFKYVAPTPTATPTPIPTESPTVPPTPSATNLAPIPNAWGGYQYFGDCVYTSVAPPSPYQITSYDATVYHTSGKGSIKIVPYISGSENKDHEMNSESISISPGDIVTFGCWIKTSAVGAGYTYNQYYGNGARIGIDFYDNYRINAKCDATAKFYPSVTDAENDAFYVHYNNGWTYRVMTFTVPSTLTADGWSGHSQGEMCTPSSMIAWFQVLDSNGQYNTNGATAWFADAVITVSHSSVSATNLAALDDGHWRSDTDWASWQVA